MIIVVFSVRMRFLLLIKLREDKWTSCHII